MIDFSSEQVISLAHAPKHLPARRAGKRPNVSTIYRWAQHGCKGIVLETVQVGGTKCTSIEALQRFFDRLTDPTLPVPSPTSKTRERSIQAAEQDLARAGI